MECSTSPWPLPAIETLQSTHRGVTVHSASLRALGVTPGTECVVEDVASNRKFVASVWPDKVTAVHPYFGFESVTVIRISKAKNLEEASKPSKIWLETTAIPADERLHFRAYVKPLLYDIRYLVEGQDLHFRWCGKSVRVTVRSLTGVGSVFRITKAALVLVVPQCRIARQTKLGGLKKELENLKSELRSADGRSVLVHGPSGCGKSSLIRLACDETQRVPAFLDRSRPGVLKELQRLFLNTDIVVLHGLERLFPKEPQRSELDAKEMIENARSLLEGKEEQVQVVGETSKPQDVDPSILNYFMVHLHVGTPDPVGRAEILVALLEESGSAFDCDAASDFARDRLHGFVGMDIKRLVQQALVIKTGPLVSAEDLDKAASKVSPSALNGVALEIPKVAWEEIGGQEAIKRELIQAVSLPLKRPDLLKRFRIRAPRGILLYGPPGCSKTLLAKALATSAGVNFLAVKGPEVFSKWVGESERSVREIFMKARQSAPSILFMDEVDAIGGKRGESSGVQERVLAQLLTEMDGSVTELKDVLVVGATNRPDLMDAALLRPGRFDRVVYVGPPDQEARRRILQIRLEKMQHGLKDDHIDFLASATQGMTGAEVVAVCQEAATCALAQSIEAESVQWEHFQEGLRRLKARRRVLTPQLLGFYENLRVKGFAGIQGPRQEGKQATSG